MSDITLVCPNCKSDRVGSADHVLCTAHGTWVENADGKREFEGEGETTVHWDTQEPADDDAPCYCRSCDWGGKPEDLVKP